MCQASKFVIKRNQFDLADIQMYAERNIKIKSQHLLHSSTCGVNVNFLPLFLSFCICKKTVGFFLSYLAPWSAKFFLLTFFKSGKQYSVVTLVGRIVQQAAIIRRISSICTWNVEQA